MRDSDTLVIRLCSESMLAISVSLVGGPEREAISTWDFVPLLFPAANEKPEFEIFFTSANESSGFGKFLVWACCVS